jgi:hypothetical protein
VKKACASEKSRAEKLQPGPCAAWKPPSGNRGNSRRAFKNMARLLDDSVLIALKKSETQFLFLLFAHQKQQRKKLVNNVG